MPTALFDIQCAVGESLLAAGWHASSIAVSSKPASAWVVFDPSRRIRVRMQADLAEVMVEVTATEPPGRAQVSPQWRLTVHHAPAAAVIKALQAASSTHERGAARNHGAITGALAAAGMRPDRSRLVRALSGTGTWFSPDRHAHAIWTAPYPTQAGGWQILTPTAHLEATPETPAAVLTPLITTHSPAQEETER